MGNHRIATFSVQCAWCRKIKWAAPERQTLLWGQERRRNMPGYAQGMCPACKKNKQTIISRNAVGEL